MSKRTLSVASLLALFGLTGYGALSLAIAADVPAPKIPTGRRSPGGSR